MGEAAIFFTVLSSFLTKCEPSGDDDERAAPTRLCAHGACSRPDLPLSSLYRQGGGGAHEYRSGPVAESGRDAADNGDRLWVEYHRWW